jgi:malonyl-CoA O-methyltransferase
MDFGQSADFYHTHASVQKEAAERLIISLKEWAADLSPGPIMELGCGTGFLSQELLHFFPDREFILNDASLEMIDICRRQMNGRMNVRFEIAYAQEISIEEPILAMVISNFVIQWFRRPADTLKEWLKTVPSGGILAAAFPGYECFPTWRRCTRELGLPFTANPLPDINEIAEELSSDNVQVDYRKDVIVQRFKSAVHFFYHLKRTGANSQQKGRHLTPKEMKALINYWDNQQEGDVEVNWEVAYLWVKKNSIY